MMSGKHGGSRRKRISASALPRDLKDPDTLSEVSILEVRDESLSLDACLPYRRQLRISAERPFEPELATARSRERLDLVFQLGAWRDVK
jgi:hypothetical protein